MSSFNSVSDVVYTVQGATWCWLVSTWECTSVYKGMFLRVTSVSKVWVTGVYKMIYNCTSDRQKSIRWCTFQWRVSLWCTWDLQGPCTVLYVHVHCKVYAFLLHSQWCTLYCTYSTLYTHISEWQGSKGDATVFDGTSTRRCTCEWWVASRRLSRWPPGQ